MSPESSDWGSCEKGRRHREKATVRRWGGHWSDAVVSRQGGGHQLEKAKEDSEEPWPCSDDGFGLPGPQTVEGKVLVVLSH